MDPRLQDLLAGSVSAMPDPFLLARPGVDDQFICVFANEAAAAQFTCPASELVGRELASLVPGPQPGGFRGMFAEVLASGRTLTLDDAGFALAAPPAGTPVLDLMAYRVGPEGDGALALTWRSAAPSRDGGAQNLLLAASGSVLALVNEGVIVQDQSGQVLMANPAALRILAMSWEEMSGIEAMTKKVRELREDGTLLAPHELPGPRALASGQPVHDAVIGVVVDDDSPRWLLVNSDPMPARDGQVRVVTSTFTDITRYRQALLDLAATDRQFAEVTDALTDPLLVTEPVLLAGRIVELRVERANRAGLGLLELVGGALGDAILGRVPAAGAGSEGQPLAELVLAAAQSVWDSGRPAQTLLQCPEPDGEARIFQVKFEQVGGASGTRIAAIARDVTGDVRLRAELERSRQEAETDRTRLQATMDSLLDPHATLRVIRDDVGHVADLAYEDINRSGAAFWDVTPEDLIGATVSELVPGPVAGQILTLLTHFIDSRVPLMVDDFPAPDGIFQERRWFDLRAVMVGESISVAWRDVTDRHVAAQELARSEARYRSLTQASSDIIAHTAMDRTIEYVSPSVTQVLGWQPEDLVGRNATQLWHEDDQEGAARMVAEARAPGHTTAGFRGRMICADGRFRWVDVRLSRLPDTGTPARGGGGQPAGFVAAIRDVEQQRRTELELQASQELLRGIIDTSTDPWVLLEAVRDESGQIVDFVYADANLAACRANEQTREELIGSRLLDVLPAHGPSGLVSAYARVVETGEPLTMDDLPFAGVDGRERRFDNRAVKVGDGISFFWRDVTDRYLHRQELARLAAHDPLTGLVNREELRRRMADVFAGVRVTDQPVAVLFADLDQFKEINDTLGHAAGDEVLRTVANRISDSVRGGDIVARMGGDEFVMVLPGVPDRGTAIALAEKIRAAVRLPILAEGTRVQVSLSVGLALADRGSDPEHVIREADAALYQAKTAGRDRVAMMDLPDAQLH